MDRFCLEVRGELACFTRPEMKVERVSYDVITPSAARAVFEAILWKPAICWHIERIEVLQPVRWLSLRRNEVAAVVSTRLAQTAMQSGRGQLGFYVEEERQQRAGLLLRDVAYRLHARLELLADESPAKYAEMFRRRAAKGQCFHQPYLGCREFACDFRLIETPVSGPPPEPIDADLGWMLFDLDFTDRANPKPLFFRARLQGGVLDVPARDSQEVRG